MDMLILCRICWNNLTQVLLYSLKQLKVYVESQKKRLNSVETVQEYRDFWSWTEHILHYEMAMGLWWQEVEG